MGSKKSVQAKRIDLIADYKKVFTEGAGERVLYDLMKKGHFMHTSYQGNATECVFMEGERNIINYILTTIKQDPVKLKEMIENHENEELDYV